LNSYVGEADAMPVAMPEATEAEIAEAKRLGHEAGLVSSNVAGDCPYGFQPPKPRHAWMVGFSEGRIEAKKKASIPFA
jgi:hypothetical protein